MDQYNLEDETLEIALIIADLNYSLDQLEKGLDDMAAELRRRQRLHAPRTCKLVDNIKAEAKELIEAL